MIASSNLPGPLGVDVTTPIASIWPPASANVTLTTSSAVPPDSLVTV